MEHIDLRKLNNDELYAIRKQVVRLKKQGRKGAEIEEITGLYQTRISQIWQAYQARRKKDTGRRLTAEEEKAIRAVIINKVPEQLKLAGCLWTRAKICAYIKRVYRKSIVPQVISRYLKRWGLTCQRSTKRAYGQDIARIEKFKNEEYPAIAKRAKAENAYIYWGDETGVDNRENYERGFAEKGKPPVLPLPTKKNGLT